MIDFGERERRLIGNAVILYGFFAILVVSLQAHTELRYAVTAADWPMVAATAVPTNRYVRCGRLRRDCAEYQILYRFQGASHESFGVHSKTIERQPLLLKVDPERPWRFLVPPGIERGRSLVQLVMLAGMPALIYASSRWARKEEPPVEGAGHPRVERK